MAKKDGYKYILKLKSGSVIHLGEIPFRVIDDCYVAGNNEPYESSAKYELL
jgi:hypothetical protein